MHATDASPAASDQYQPSRRGLDALLEFETLISDLSSRFVNLRAGEVDCEIQGALRRVSAFLGVDFAVIWQWSSAVPGTGAFTATHFHYSEEGRQPPETLRQEQFPWYVGQLLAGRTVIHRSLEEFPAAANVDQGECPPARHRVEPVSAAHVGGRAARGRPRLQQLARGTRLAGCGGEASCSWSRRSSPTLSRASATSHGFRRARSVWRWRRIPQRRDSGLSIAARARSGPLRDIARSSGTRPTRSSTSDASSPPFIPKIGSGCRKPSTVPGSAATRSTSSSGLRPTAAAQCGGSPREGGPIAARPERSNV